MSRRSRPQNGIQGVIALVICVFPCKVLAIIAGFDISLFSSIDGGNDNLIYSFLNRLSEDQKEVGTFVLWHIWNDLNVVVFEGRGRYMNFVGKKALYLLKNYHDAQPSCAISNVSLRT